MSEGVMNGPGQSCLTNHFSSEGVLGRVGIMTCEPETGIKGIDM